MPEQLEPWLRGPLDTVPPAVAGVIRALEQVAEDIPRFTSGITDGQLWSGPVDPSTIGFQLKHIAGSLDRLATYLNGQPLSPLQLEALADEHKPGWSLGELLIAVEHSLRKAHGEVSKLREPDFRQTCYIGRQRIPVPAIALAIHIAEHTQRHLGELIVLCRFATSSRSPVTGVP